MRIIRPNRIFLLCMLFVFHQQLKGQVYLDSTVSVPDRVEDLLQRLTLAEKIGQMTQADLSSLKYTEIESLMLGSVLSGGGSDPVNNYPETWADVYDSCQAHALKTRLAVPIIYGVDAVHGHNNVIGATIFPHNIGLGCTRNPELIKKAGEITAKEVAATGINWTFAPCIAVPRDERWGRTYEGFGETPELAELLAPPMIEGLQGNNLGDPGTILACAKHYLADGGTQGGDDQGNAVMDEATLRAVHLPGYIKAIESGVGSVMASFSSWNGEKMHGNKYLLTDVLKNELGFEGFVVSDWAGINQVDGNFKNAVEKSINAGIDMAMAPNDYKMFISTLTDLVNEGGVSEERINDAVRRILTKKFELGLFEHAFADRNLLASVGSENHRNTARQCVRESLVLLKNKNSVLPLSKDQNVYMAGRFAKDLGAQCGGWTISWQGSNGNITEGTNLYEAVREVVGANSVVYSLNGSQGNTDGAQAGIVVIGEDPYAEGNGDRSSLNLRSDDISAVKNVYNQGLPVVVVLFSGRPLILDPILDYCDAIVAAWLPGTEGEGITDVLFGDYDFKGELSHTWPKSNNQLPINWGDANYNPLYEYGFGLDYTKNSVYNINRKQISVSYTNQKQLCICNLPGIDVNVDLVDLYGRIVLETRINQGTQNFSVNLDQIPNGMYIVKISSINKLYSTSKIWVN